MNAEICLGRGGFLRSFSYLNLVSTDEEISAAALQFVRKVSGYRQPSKANEAAFNTAVADIARASRRMLESLTASRASK